MNGRALVLKTLMRERGITNVELAEKLNVSKPTVSYIINGKTLPSLKVLADIAQILGVTMGELFDDYDAHSTQSSSTLRCPKCGAELKLTENVPTD